MACREAQEAREVMVVREVTEALAEMKVDPGEASEVQTATVAQVVTTASEVQMEMEALEAQTATEVRVATETSEVHKVTEALVATTLEDQTVTVARREDLREPLQTADAETGPTTKVVPTLV